MSIDLSRLPASLAEVAKTYYHGEADGDLPYAIDIASDEITYRLRYSRDEAGDIAGVEVEWIKATPAEAEARSTARTAGLWPDAA
jgi:hypothetical protein